MKLTGSIFLLILFLANTHLMSQELGSLIDTRDNKEYVTVDLLIKMEAGITKKRTWLGENLAYASPNASCYKDEPAFCEAFGRLYPWEDAVTVCPEGWHLPSEKEWTEVIDSFGGRNSSGSALRSGGKVI
ncbi:MAG: FISUMP domain-containing protein [Bacteroidetes bacterium]|nr:FISUMP domain-containing protein [Bacteroidota bacterium]